MIPCQELNVIRQIRVKYSYESNLYPNKILDHINTKLPKVLLRPWAESWIHLSHKRTLWIEETEWKFRKKGMQQDSYAKDKSPKKHKRCKMAWEWGTKEYFYLPYVTILWHPSWKLPEDIGKNETHFLGLERVTLTLKSWFPFPKLDYSQWLKVHIFSIWEIQMSRRIQHVRFIVKQFVT